MTLSREFRDLGTAAAFSALLFSAGFLLPLLGPPAAFISATPIVWLSARHGGRAGALGALLATAILLPVLPPPVALIYAVERAAPAWYLGRRLGRGGGIVAGSAAAALAVTAVMAGGALLFAPRGVDPAQVLEQQLREGLAELGASGDRAAAVGANLELVLAYIRRALPAITLIGVFLECALSALLAARALPPAAATLPLRLTGFRLPEWLVWVVIPTLALCLAAPGEVATWAINLLLPLLFAYLIQGLSISLHLAARARLTRLGRALFACSLIVFPWLLALPLLLGLLDFRFGFRQRWPLA